MESGDVESFPGRLHGRVIIQQLACFIHKVSTDIWLETPSAFANQNVSSSMVSEELIDGQDARAQFEL